MTKSLQDAFEEASKLPQSEQEAIAAFILEEMHAEKRWADLLARSPEKLAAMADEALAEDRNGQTKPFNSDRDLAND